MQQSNNVHKLRYREVNRYATQDFNSGKILLHHTFEIPLTKIKKACLVDVISPEGRFTWLNLNKRKRIKGIKSKYTVEMIIPKTDPEIKHLWNVILAAAKQKHGDNPAEWALLLGYPIKDGDEYVVQGRGQHYAGHWVISSAVSTKTPIKCQKSTPPLNVKASTIYPGCYGRIKFTVLGYDLVCGSSKGVTLFFDSIMKTREGEALTINQELIRKQ